MNWGKLPPTPACIIMLMMIINGLKGKGRFIVHTHIYIYMFINQASDCRTSANHRMAKLHAAIHILIHWLRVAPF